jgi:hypothetical protein
MCQYCVPLLTIGNKAPCAVHTIWNIYVIYYILYSSTQRQEQKDETALMGSVKKEDNYETNERQINPLAYTAACEAV